MKITPLNDYVIVKLQEQEEVTSGGIILTAANVKRPNRGSVVAVSSQNISEGDTVLFGEWGGITAKIDDEELLFIKEEEIMGVLS